MHALKSGQVLRMSEDPSETQPAFLIIKKANTTRQNPDSGANSTDAMQQELNREREENEKLKELYNKISEEKEQLMIDFKAKSDLCAQLKLELDEIRQVPAQPAEYDDLTDIP